MVGFAELKVCMMIVCFVPFLPDFRTRILTRFVYDSSYGQTLSTSTFIGETMFAILIAIFGLVLFAHLIGNMQVFEILCNFLSVSGY